MMFYYILLRKIDVNLKLIHKSNKQPVLEYKVPELNKFYLIETYWHAHVIYSIVKLVGINMDLVSNGETDKERFRRRIYNEAWRKSENEYRSSSYRKSKT